MTVSVSVLEPSLTRTVKLKVPGFAGTQLKSPVVASMAAPAGAPLRLKVRGSLSGSVAVAVNVTACPTAAV